MDSQLRGVVIGGTFVLLGSVLVQIIIGTLQVWQSEHHYLRATEDRAAQWKREDELAEKRDQDLVFERMWERRADAYDDLLATLGRIQINAQIAFDYGLNGKGEAAEKRMSTAYAAVVADIPKLEATNLYWNDRTMQAVQEYLTGFQSATRIDAPAMRKDLICEAMTYVIPKTKTLASMVRTEGREHLRDKRKGVANAAEDAINATSGR
jgi:hypothetical protein